ncbi:hypothetical protein GKE82_26275 [Conexibacter sp. W3-3-2]|uniref:MauE/DoxX family redox-associated membrane protein n=1 Tax=Conexibacter sp. W3-3-2 TaxID=2675227 RepID=UPI0012B7E712|nr:MauE/DoxX family redox-associated membrane protein [Conexibacter sp. W3-3-2]MTD47628.1 hypothetical protein [Conexibacter sp. W3-3-2]MTD47713.1 hypothetical protein [Conexibacter sp. W3-3-2]
MSGATLIGIWLFGSLLLAAGAAKAVAREQTSDMLVALGMRKRLAAAGAVAVPIVELAIGVGSFTAPTSELVAGAVIAVFAAFAGAGAVAMRRGIDVPCACFGAVQRRPKSLGKQQISLFMVALVMIVPALMIGYLPSDAPVEGAEGAAFGLALSAAAVAILGGSSWWKVRGARRSMDEARLSTKSFAAEAA